MTIQQLRQFCILAEYENITSASKALFITQPALSMVLKNVETELGTPLFDRKGRNIYLNHFGKDFYNFAKRTLVDYDALLEKFHFPHQESEALRFCYSSAYIPDYVLPAFSADNPNIPITINEVKEKMIPHFILNEIYDIAISSLKCEDNIDQKLISTNFFRNRLLVSVPFNNPLASRKSLTLEALSGQKFFRLSKHGEFSDELDALAKSKGVQMNVVQRVNYEIIKKLQKDYDFLYFITTLQAQFDYIPMNRKLIPVEEELFMKSMYVTYLKNNEEKALQFIGWAKQKLIDFADPS